MNDTRRPSAAQWAEQPAKHEVPPITSMANTLDKFSSDDDYRQLCFICNYLSMRLSLNAAR